MPASRAKKYMWVANQQIYHSKVHVDSTLQVCDSAVKKFKKSKKKSMHFLQSSATIHLCVFLQDCFLFLSSLTNICSSAKEESWGFDAMGRFCRAFPILAGSSCCCWSFSYSAILRSQADSLYSHVILCCCCSVLLYVHRNHRFIRDRSPGHPPRLSHSSWALMWFCVSE